MEASQEYGPSKTAVEAVTVPLGRYADHRNGDTHDSTAAESLLAIAHDPALGLDRSVCLRDVVKVLRVGAHPVTGSVYEAAKRIEREFGAG